MAPERFAGQGDHRSDVYALTCLLYEALTGEQPFVRESTAALIYVHLHTWPPSVAGRSAVAALDPVIARGMAKDAADRFASASELATAARAALCRARHHLGGAHDDPGAGSDSAPRHAPGQTAAAAVAPPARTRSSRRPNATQTKPNRTPPEATAGPTALPERSKRHAWSTPVIEVAVDTVVVLVLAAAGGLARLWVVEQYYVGVDGDQVRIFQGVRGDVLGVPLHEVVERTDLNTSDLTESDRSAIYNGIMSSRGSRAPATSSRC